MIEAASDGFPTRCLRCGDMGQASYLCSPCARASTVTEYNALRDAWDQGDRDFPRGGVNSIADLTRRLEVAEKALEAALGELKFGTNDWAIKNVDRALATIRGTP